MTTRPSNDAIAQAFWEWVDKNWSLGEVVFAPADLLAAAYEIDAQPCATPDNREVSGLANSEWVMVPKEPTEAMLNAGIAARRAGGATAETYLAMIAASPTPPKQEVGEMDRTAPPRVWLQVDTEGDPEDRSEAIPEDLWMDMSWHYSPIGGQEIEYVRSDLTQPAPTPDVIREQKRGENAQP